MCTFCAHWSAMHTITIECVSRRHAYAWPRQPGLATRTSNIPASTCIQQNIIHCETAMDETWRQISKLVQPNGPPDVALRQCKVSCHKTHSCRSKTLKHSTLLLRCLMLQAAHNITIYSYYYLILLLLCSRYIRGPFSTWIGSSGFYPLKSGIKSGATSPPPQFWAEVLPQFLT